MKPELLALLAAGCWTIQAIGLRTAVQTMPATHAVTLAVLIESAIGGALVLLWFPNAELDRRGVLAAIITGIAGIGGFLLVAQALRERGETASIIALANAYPLVILVLAVLIFGEPVTPARAAGVACITLGVWLVLAR